MSVVARRTALGSLLAALPRLDAAASPRAGLPDGWADFRARFVAPDGRVVDTGNEGISHSEGQGWGLFLAERHDDRQAFDLILDWTRRHLRRADHPLHAWRWRSGRGVEDRNNATDGDIAIASALLHAGRRWGERAHTEEGTAIAREVLRRLVRRTAGLALLLPGERGFEHRRQVVVNPSYYAFPMLPALAEAVPDPAWIEVANDGLRLLRTARFGRWGLTPDWITVGRADGVVAIAQGWPPRFAYDAVRVPLWLTWAGMSDHPAVGAAVDFWTDPAHRQLPAWCDLTTDRTSPYAAGAEIGAVARLSCERRGRRLPVAERPNSSRRQYYDSALLLFSRLAEREMA